MRRSTTEMFESVVNLKPEGEWRPGMALDKLKAEMDPRTARRWPPPPSMPSVVLLRTTHL